MLYSERLCTRAHRRHGSRVTPLRRSEDQLAATCAEREERRGRDRTCEGERDELAVAVANEMIGFEAELLEESQLRAAGARAHRGQRGWAEAVGAAET